MMRVRLLAVAAAMLLAAVVTGCGDNQPGTTAASTSEPATTAGTTTEPTTTGPPPTTDSASTTAAQLGPTVAWQEPLALGSTVAVRHLVVSNGVFLAITEADFRHPGDVIMTPFTSVDGETWTQVELPPDQFADVVLFEAGGGPLGFVATGARIDDTGAAAGSYVWTSPNAEDWTPSELISATVPKPASPFIFDATHSVAVAVTPTQFVAVAEIRRHFDLQAILDAHAPDFEWPEFASMATRNLDGGDIQLTIGGEGGNDFVASFSQLGIDPDEMPVGDIESDFISLSMGSTVWASADGIDWFESQGPEFSSSSPLVSQLAVDATGAGLLVHGYEEFAGELVAWHSTDGSDWTQVDLPGRPVADWSGGLYSFDQRGHFWLSSDGSSWTDTAGPTAIADSRELTTIAGTPDSVIAVAGIRRDAAWQNATVPESWVAVSTDGETWWEATGVEAFGMPIWPEAIAADGDRIVLGLVGEPSGAMPQTYLWMGTVTGP